MTRLFGNGWLIGAALVAAAPAFAQLPTYRPGQEYRSLNTDQYEIEIQKNGRLDVGLVTGQPVFRNAFPMVWLEGEEEPELLPIDGRWSGRNPVKDVLGQGQGMMLKRKSVEWYLRAYPTKPFFAVQVAFVNDGKKPVSVHALMPWCTGYPKEGGLDLGPGSLEAIGLVHAGGESELSRGGGQSEQHIAMVNPASGRTLIAGFLTGTHSMGSIEVRRTEDGEENELDFFRALCTYDPPVMLVPGGRLESEVVYVAVSEANVFEGLERFAAASGLANNVSIPDTARHDVLFLSESTVGSVSAETQSQRPAEEISIPDGTPMKQLHEGTIGSWGGNGEFGVVDYVRLAARRYYVTPFLGTHVPPALDVNARGLTIEQQRAYLTAQAMLGGPIVLTGTPISEEVLSIAERLSPTPDRPARPLDLFLSDVPSVFALPVRTKTDAAHVVSVFNWDGASDREFALNFEALGMDPSTAYTAFDFWQGRYHGLAQGTLTVEVAPGSVRVFGFRRYENRPMVLSLDDHFTQRAQSIAGVQWNPVSKQLEGELDAEAGRAYRMQVLVPAPYVLETASHTAHVDGEVAEILFEAPESAIVRWFVRFR